MQPHLNFYTLLQLRQNKKPVQTATRETTKDKVYHSKHTHTTVTHDQKQIDTHPLPPPCLSSNTLSTACVNEKWIGCLLAEAGTGANAVCISSDGTFVLMHYVWAGQDSCNIQRARKAVGEANTACSQHDVCTSVCVCVCVCSELCHSWTVNPHYGRLLTRMLF